MPCRNGHKRGAGTVFKQFFGAFPREQHSARAKALFRFRNVENPDGLLGRNYLFGFIGGFKCKPKRIGVGFSLHAHV